MDGAMPRPTSAVGNSQLPLRSRMEQRNQSTIPTTLGECSSTLIMRRMVQGEALPDFSRHGWKAAFYAPHQCPLRREGRAMLLQRLVEYTERLDLPPTLYSNTPVPYIIELNTDG